MCFYPVGERDHAIEAVRLMNESKIFPVGSKGSTELRERANLHAAQAGVCALNAANGNPDPLISRHVELVNAWWYGRSCEEKARLERALSI